MKNIFLSFQSAVTVLLCVISCTEKEAPYRDNALNGTETFSITGVKEEGFQSAYSVRSSYTPEFAVKFETGDRLGLLLVGKDNSQIANVAFDYSADGSWTPENELFYSSDISKIIAYFPYNDAVAKDVTTAGSLADMVVFNTDQSSTENFRNMDLLLCEIDNPQPKLDILFSHAFSMIALSASESITVGDETVNYTIGLNNVSVSLGETVYYPYLSKGIYAFIIKPGEQLKPNEFRYFYSRNSKTYVKTVRTELTTVAGTRYSFACPSASSGTEIFNKGDYYCISRSSNNVFVLPGEASIPDNLECKGVVFHEIEDFEEFCSVNGLPASDYPGYKGHHGLIVSPVSGLNFGDGDVSRVQEALSGVAEHGSTDISNGYLITKALLSSDKISFKALDNHKDNVVKNATSWYAPSFNELKYLLRGNSPDEVSTDGMALVNSRIGRIQPNDQLAGNIPSVTFKDGQGFCLMSGGDEMGWHGIPGGETFRPVCAF